MGRRWAGSRVPGLGLGLSLSCSASGLDGQLAENLDEPFTCEI